jgi:predicted RNA-binding protein associated with RNAse of E/G family
MCWITVSKQDEKGKETWRYQAKLLARDVNCIQLEANFDRADTKIAGMLLARGDRFVETYYTDRWYNIFEIHNRENDQLRGWYCNIGCPAEINGNTLSYIDLALDLLVFPDGRQIVLDEDEFAALDISAELRIKARTALAELQENFRQKGQD